MRSGLVGLAAALLLAAAPACAQDFEAQLDPAPFDATTRADILGSIGHVTATLNGNTLSISGTFQDMTSAATGASVRIGLAKGVLGDAVGPLTATRAPQGSVSGSVQLNAQQLEALKRQALYVRVDSEKAPDGNLQGWLEPQEKSKEK
jgi:hypothetical protein